VKSIVLIHLPTQLATNWLLTNHSRYEKRNDISHCLSHRRTDAGFLLKHAGDHYYYNASNHSYRSAATAHTNNNDNNAYGRRLLINGAGCGLQLLEDGPVGRLPISKRRPGGDRLPAFAYHGEANRPRARSLVNRAYDFGVVASALWACSSSA